MNPSMGMRTSEERAGCSEAEVFEFINALRQAGKLDVDDAASQLIEEFGISRGKANRLWVKWMHDMARIADLPC